jgi:hypothetical protein
MKIIKTVIKAFFTPEMIGRLSAWLIALLLRKASKSGKWDSIKAIVQKVFDALQLFNDVYADDEMTPEEEEQVAQKIESVMGD